MHSRRASATATHGEATHPQRSARPAPPPHPLVALQRSAGNQVVAALLSRSIQRTPAVSAPGDLLEQEADQVADQVMRMVAPRAASSAPLAVQRMCAGCEEEQGHVHRAPAGEGEIGAEAAEAAAQVAGRGGMPLPESARSFFEPRFGQDFGHVRVHADAEAAQAAHGVQARAYTVGSSIVFARGEYAPQTSTGQRLLAHELAHVVQQSGIAQRTKEPQDEGEPEPEPAAPRAVLRAPAPPGPAAPFTSSTPPPVPILLAGEAQGERFHYVVSTDRFRPGEEQRLRAFARVLPGEGTLEIHGFASEEGTPELNERLSSQRAIKAREILVGSGVPEPRISGLYAHGATPGARPTHRSVVIDIKPPQVKPGPRPLDPGTTSALGHLHRLAVKASAESGGGPDFHKAVEDFKKQLKADLEAVPAGQTLPDDLRIVVEALLLWDADTGGQWGEGRLDSRDFTPSAAAYAVVPAAQNKCNAFLGEVIFKATGLVHQGHLKEGKTGTDPRAWFPFRAKEWGDASFAIPNFPVVKSPVRGDILCTGGHVGIYLGNYNTKDLYISARDDAMDVFGIGEQFAHGIQIKYTKTGIYRRFTP